MKNRTFKLMYQTAYCAFSLIAAAASVGFFDGRFNRNFYVYFTMLSNYYCMAVMTAELVQTVRRKEDALTDIAPRFKFCGVIMILLTGCVFNLILTNGFVYDVGSVLLHIVLPAMFVADWFLFYRRGMTRWFDPLIAFGAVMLYACFIFLRAPAVPVTRVRYPYFFINPDQIGWPGVIRWIAMLSAVFIAAGYILLLIDHITAGNTVER